MFGMVFVKKSVIQRLFKMKQQEKMDENLEESLQETKEMTNSEATETQKEKDIDAVDEKDSKIAELEKTVEDLKQELLYKVAEFDNFRKRTLKEKAELILNGGEKVITSLLPVLDDFERAQENTNKAKDIEALKEGLELIQKKFVSILESNGLNVIEAVGQDFNTDFHEAIAMIPAPTPEEKGKVLDCVQIGYKLNEKVIRHAKVAIGQ